MILALFAGLIIGSTVVLAYLVGIEVGKQTPAPRHPFRNH